VDPVRNPYAPGAGQRPPELAGRDGELQSFDVLLERVARSRPERSVVLTGLRGVGKTVLLNAMRGGAVRRGWGTGKLEARPGQALRHPLAAALHLAVRELAQPDKGEAEHVLGVVKAFAQEPRHRAEVRRRGTSGRLCHRVRTTERRIWSGIDVSRRRRLPGQRYRRETLEPWCR